MQDETEVTTPEPTRLGDSKSPTEDLFPKGTAAGWDPSHSMAASRVIESHVVNGANRKLKIEVLGPPGAGGAESLYRVSGFEPDRHPATLEGARARNVLLLFQEGAIAETGVNGITHEVLLAILIDRLQAFQAGQFACNENELALQHLRAAAGFMAARTNRRLGAGTEGTHSGS